MIGAIVAGRERHFDERCNEQSPTFLSFRNGSVRARRIAAGESEIRHTPTSKRRTVSARSLSNRPTSWCCASRRSIRKRTSSSIRKVATSRASIRPTSSATTSAAAASIRANGSTAMEWAEVGKTAVFFHNGGASETCIGTYWYQAYAGGEWWNLSHGEPFLLRSFAGNAEKLAAARHRHARRARKSSPRAWWTATRMTCTCAGPRSSALKVEPQAPRLQPQARFRRLGRRGLPPRCSGMPGFTHYLAALHARRSRCPGDLRRRHSTATASPTCAWSGRAGSPCCKTAANRYTKSALPGVTRLPRRRLGRLQRRRQTRSAAGHADAGPEAVHQPRQEPIPRRQPAVAAGESAWNLTAAAWLDYDGDGKPDILLGNGFHGLRLYRNAPPNDSRPKCRRPSSATGISLAPLTTPIERASRRPIRRKRKSI